MTRLTLPQAAARLGMTRGHLWRLVRAGKLPAERLGPLWTVEADDLRLVAAPAGTGRPRKGTTMETYTVYADPARAEFGNNYTLAAESVTYEEDTTYDGRAVEAYTFVARPGRVEHLEALLASDAAVVAWGREPAAG